MTPEQFWDSCPRTITALHKQWQKVQVETQVIAARVNAGDDMADILCDMTEEEAKAKENEMGLAMW